MKKTAGPAIAFELIEAIPEPVVVSDSTGRIVAVNSPAGTLFGRRSEDLAGQALRQFFEPHPDNMTSGWHAVRCSGVINGQDKVTVAVQTVASQLGRDGLNVMMIRGALDTGSCRANYPGNVLESLSEGVLIVAASGTILYLNRAAREMLDVDEDTLPEFDVRELLIQSHWSDHRNNGLGHLLDRVLTESEHLAGKQALLRATPTATTSVEVSVNATPLGLEHGQASGAIVTLQNITRQAHVEMQISTQKQVLDLIAAGTRLEDTATAIVEYLERVIPGTCGAIYQIERESRRATLLAAPNLAQSINDLSADDAESPVLRLITEALVSRQPLIFPRLSENGLQDDATRLLLDHGIESIWCYPIDGSAGQNVGVVCLYRDRRGAPDSDTQELIDTAIGLLRVALDRVHIERELRYQSFNDDLTGLPNRVSMMDRLGMTMQHAAQSDNGVALLLLDIDKFQMVNNSLGHEAGDTLLREVAKRLRENVRSDDLVARFTGDSFGVLLERITSEADASSVVMRIQRAFATPLNISGVDVYVSVCIGVALEDPTAPDPETLVRFADIALDRAKGAGQGQFAVFSPAQDLSGVPKIELQSRLHRALAADALELHYQPVMSLHEQKVAGYEGLVRWTDSQFGVVPPDEFLPLAQQAGIMSEITSWVLDRAVTQLCEWRAEFGDEIFVAVNISPEEMRDSLIIEQIDAVLNRYQVNPQCLMLEVTEHALLDTTGHTNEILERLRNLGVQIALDDFGTGYSSLSYLEYLAVDVIKIDRAFIQAARGSGSRTPVATAMVDLARKLGMLSVAEGIETAEDERIARQLGCDLSQGYYYGRPHPVRHIGLADE